MNGELILAWDLGTSGNKASLYDVSGSCLAETTLSYPTYYTREGWHEQCPDDWWKAIVETTRALLDKTGIDPTRIVCCGISGHSMGTVLLDREGKLLNTRAPIWSDSRAVDESRDFLGEYGLDAWYSMTGAGTKPESYPIFKLVWYRRHYPELFAKVRTVLGTSDYVNYHLTGRLTTGRSNACGSGAYDLLRGDFDEGLLTGNGLRRDMFPEIVEETDIIGKICPAAARQLGLATETLVTAGGTDNICMAVGARCYVPGRAYVALGTSCWIAWTGTKPAINPQSFPYVFPMCGGLFNTGLSLASGGSAYKWVKETLCADLESEAEKQGKNVYALMEELIAGTPAGANGLLFNSCLGGGMPFDPGINMRGGFLGLQLRHTRADMLRATLEGITFKLRECKEQLEKVATFDSEILLVGGGSKTAAWRQIIADCFGNTVLKSTIDDQASALGAAAFAAVGTGLWKDYARIDSLHTIEARHEPDPRIHTLYNELFDIYRRGSAYLSHLGDDMKRLGM